MSFYIATNLIGMQGRWIMPQINTLSGDKTTSESLIKRIEQDPQLAARIRKSEDEKSTRYYLVIKLSPTFQKLLDAIYHKTSDIYKAEVITDNFDDDNPRNTKLTTWRTEITDPEKLFDAMQNAYAK